MHRHDAIEARLRGGRAGLPLCGVARADGAGHPEPLVHRGGPVQRQFVRHVGGECARGGGKVQALHPGRVGQCDQAAAGGAALPDRRLYQAKISRLDHVSVGWGIEKCSILGIQVAMRAVFEIFLF